MAQEDKIYKTWTKIKEFLGAPKNLELQYHEYDYYYHIFVLEAGKEYFTELWKDTSQVKGINATQNDLDLDDFEDNYKSDANQAIEMDVTVENDITVGDFGSGASVDANIEGDVNVEQGKFKIFTDPDQSGDSDKGPVSIVEKSGDYKELAVTDEDVKSKLDEVYNVIKDMCFSNDAIVQIEYMSDLLWSGKVFEFSEHYSLQNENYMDYLIITNGFSVHIFWNLVSELGLCFKIYENPTVTDNGTLTQIYNSNRNYSDSSFNFNFYKNPSVSNTGTRVRCTLNLGSNQTSTESISNEIILTENETYLIRIISLGNGNLISYHQTMYERNSI